MDLPTFQDVKKLAKEQLEILKNNFKEKFNRDVGVLKNNIETQALTLDEKECINLTEFIGYYYNASSYRYDTEFDLQLFLLRNHSIYELKCQEEEGKRKYCGKLCMKKN
jgi:hypothetical protein